MALPSLSSHLSLHRSSYCCSSSSSVTVHNAGVALRFSDQRRQRVRASPSRGGVVAASLQSVDQLSGGSDEAKVRDDAANQLPLREIPGGYGIPFLSQWVNRWRFLFIEDGYQYWESRMAQHKSTVIRTNMPPGWPWTDSRCVMFLDQKSFPPCSIYNDKVDKSRTFAGTFMPSTSFTGGLEMCAYLDTTNKKHAQLKVYCFELLKLAAPNWASEFHTSIASAFLQWDQTADVFPAVRESLFRFLIKVITSADLDDPKIPKAEKPSAENLEKWTGLQLFPVLNSKTYPVFIEELIHLVPLPAKITEEDYNQMVKFLQKYADETLKLAPSYELSKEEAVHNVIFFLILNAHGGYCLFFPCILREVGKYPKLQAEIRAEVRAAVESNGGKITMKAVMNDMPLVASTVFECLRFEPPVPLQYGRARRDFEVESHDARFQIKKGELLGGVNYFASRDPKVFKSEPNKFEATRFMGPEGEKLLQHLVWSNGLQTDESSVNNKQCAAKDVVPLTGRLLLAEIFMRYDSFTTEGDGRAMTFTSLQRRAS